MPESAELADSAAEARDAERLQEVTAGLSAAATIEAIADVIIEQGMPAIGATTGILGVLDGDELRFLRTTGYSDAFPERLALADPWPITEAVRLRENVELPDVGARRIGYSVPERIWADSGKGTLVAVPLLVGDRAVGALGFTRESDAELTQRERGLVETLARLAAQALDRASLAEADRRARVRAEGLVRVANAVSTAVAVHDVAGAVATEALDVLGVSGVTVLLGRGGRAEVLAARGAVESYAATEPSLSLQSETLTASAIRSGRALFAESPDELRVLSPASAEVAARMGLGALASVPLRVGERTGAISIVAAEPRRFPPEERVFLDLLARTCEQGLLRAELYDAERDALARSEMLHGLAVALSGAISPEDVGRAFLDRAVVHARAGSGALMLAVGDGDTLTTVALAGTGLTRPRWRSTLPVSGRYLVSTAFRERRSAVARDRAELERDYPDSVAYLGEEARAAHALPLTVAGSPAGAFVLVFEDERRLSEADERLLETMTDLCAQALERARLYENEHRIALRLQRALLPEDVAQHPDVLIAARYEAGADSLEVGGDWYDTFSFPGGLVGVAVGDVVGHGIEAAAAMGRLRSAFRALAADADGPGELLAKLDRFAAGPEGIDFATAGYGILDPATGELRYASAGHPPMLLVEPSGATTWLLDGRSPPLYGDEATPRIEGKVELRPGSLLLLYSDGLVERRNERISVGLERLERTAAALREEPVEVICDRLLAEVRRGSDQSDDVVLIALRALPAGTRRFQRVFAAEPGELRLMRAAMREWFEEIGLDEKTAGDLLLAVGEAAANGVEHAYHGRPGGSLRLELLAVDDRIIAHVRDFGSWRTESPPEHNRGHGTTIMRTVSEGLAVNSTPGGTSVTVQVRRRPLT
jgi:serine phosphatase RsbU (regulator of sigma subunit)/anti-sigma regulatory factor (Ser/Thr protein kinase)